MSTRREQKGVKGYVSLMDAAIYLGLPYPTIYNWVVKRGLAPSAFRRYETRWFISVADLELLEKRRGPHA